MLTVDDVTMQFRGSDAPLLENVSLSLPPGSITSVTGPNGSGKTTLLRLACGLLEPTSGSVSVAGHDIISSATAARGCLGVSLYPERSFYYRLTCRQNLRYYASLRGIFGRRSRAEIDRVMRLLDLIEMSDVVFMRLSLGQRRRLGVARSLLGSPALVLLDEPTANLDDCAVNRLHETLEGYRLDGGTVLFSTHLADDLTRVTERLCLGDRKIVRPPQHPPRSARWIRVEGNLDRADVGMIEQTYPLRRGGDHLSLLVPSSVGMAEVVDRLVAAGVEVKSFAVRDQAVPGVSMLRPESGASGGWGMPA
ncbi:ABC transporter ATP-binding protein [Pseudonocardia alni]|uniref:ABC transporter ATP-binding protein n=1 Tax=Pseudonocardia alni TaxID=33907 RepID=UPI0036A2661A